MDITRYDTKEKIEQKLKNIEVQREWFEQHPWEWQGNFKRTEEFRKLYHNYERLKAKLKKDNKNV